MSDSRAPAVTPDAAALRRRSRNNIVLFVVHLALAAACFIGFYLKVTGG